LWLTVCHYICFICVTTGGSTIMIRLLFLISNFHHVVNAVFFLLGDSASGESPKRKNTTWLFLFRVMPTILVGPWFSICTGVSMFICGQLCVCTGTLYYMWAMASHLPLALVCYTCPHTILESVEWSAIYDVHLMWYTEYSCYRQCLVISGNS
jgi:hypothetical protein